MGKDVIPVGARTLWLSFSSRLGRVIDINISVIALETILRIMAGCLFKAFLLAPEILEGSENSSRGTAIACSI